MNSRKSISSFTYCFHFLTSNFRLLRSEFRFPFSLPLNPINFCYMSKVKSLIVLPDFSLSPRIDQVGVEERASRFTKRSIKKETKMNSLKLVLNMIDLTTLEGKNT